MFDSQEMIKFAEVWFAEAEGYVEVRPILNRPDEATGAIKSVLKSARKSFAVGDWKAVSDHIAHWHEHASLAGATGWYWGVCPRTTPLREGENGTTIGGRAEDVAQYVGAWADIDDHRSDDQATLNHAPEVLRALADMGLPATFVVRSGGGQGRHVYWKFREPIPAEEGRALVEKLARVLKSDPSVSDPARILRIPGTDHTKSGTAIPVKILEEDPTTVGIDASEFEDKLELLSGRYGVDLSAAPTIERREIGMPWKPMPEDVVRDKLPTMCARVRHYVEHPNDVTEPEWFSLAGLLKSLVETPAIFHDWSRGHSKYRKREAEKKWATTHPAPRTCSALQGMAPLAECEECPLYAQHSRPSTLLRTAYQESLGMSGIFGAPTPNEEFSYGVQHGGQVFLNTHIQLARTAIKHNSAEFREIMDANGHLIWPAEIRDELEHPALQKVVDNDDDLRLLKQKAEEAIRLIANGTDAYQVRDEMMTELVACYRHTPAEVTDLIRRIGASQQAAKKAFGERSLLPLIKSKINAPSGASRKRYELVELEDGYYRVTQRNEDGTPREYEMITNFVFRPLVVYETEDGDSQYHVLATIHVRGERFNLELSIPRGALEVERDFRGLLTDQMIFYGHASDLAALKDMLAQCKPVRKHAVSCVGWHGNAFITERRVLGETDRVLLPHIAKSESLTEWPDWDPTKFQAVATTVCQNIFRLNRPEKMALISGWVMASMFAPHFRAQGRSFPLLEIWGTPGAGKTTIASLMLQLTSGKDDTGMARSSKFVRMHTLSMQNAMPICWDEYKVSEMTENDLNALHAILKHAYDGIADQRGRPTMSVQKFQLHAPVLIAGESQLSDQALRDRSIIVGLSRSDNEAGEYAEAYREITNCEVQRFGEGVIRTALKNRWLDGMIRVYFRDAYHELRETPGTDDRRAKALAVVHTGLEMWRLLAQELGTSAPAFEPKDILHFARMEEEGNDNRLPYLCKLLITTANMIRMPNDRYRFAYSISDHDGRSTVCIDRKSWYDALTLYYRDHGRQRELQDEGTTMKFVAEESEKPSSFVLHSRTQRRIDKVKCWVFVMDAQMMEEKTGIDPETFYGPENSES